MQSFEQNVITTKNKSRTLFKQKKYPELIDFINKNLREIEEQYYLDQDKFSNKFSKLVFAHGHNKSTNQVYSALASIKIMRYAGHYANGNKICAENSLYIWPFLIMWTEDNLFDLNLLISYLISVGDHEHAQKLLFRLFYGYKNTKHIMRYDREVSNFFYQKRLLTTAVSDSPVNYVYDLIKEPLLSDDCVRNKDEAKFNDKFSGEHAWFTLIGDKNQFNKDHLFSDMKLFCLTKDAIKQYQYCIYLFNFITINMDYIISHPKFGEHNILVIAVFMFLVYINNKSGSNARIFKQYINKVKNENPKLGNKLDYAETLFELVRNIQNKKYKDLKPSLIKAKL